MWKAPALEEVGVEVRTRTWWALDILWSLCVLVVPPVWIAFKLRNCEFRKAPLPVGSFGKLAVQIWPH
jgi:hypothetical protein